MLGQNNAFQQGAFAPLPGGLGPWTIISSASAAARSGTVTTGAINTTGADLIIVGINSFEAAVTPISDSAGNTWVNVISDISTDPAVGVYLYYCENPTTSASHTFSTSNDNGFGALSVVAVSGSAAPGTVYDTSNFFIQPNANAGTTTEQPGSISPASNNELLVLFSAIYNNSPAPSLSVDNSFAEQTAIASTSNNFGMSAWTLVQNPAASIDPTVTRSTGMPVGGDWVAIAAFFPTSGPAASPAVVSFVFTPQEVPDLGKARTVNALIRQVAPSISRSLATVQEAPPPGYAQVHQSLIPSVLPGKRSIFVGQEQPDLGKAKTTPALILTLPPHQGRQAFTIQELPDAWLGWARLGLPPAIPVVLVAPSISHLSTSQETPFHPGSWTLPWPQGFGFIPPPPVIPVATYYMLEDHWVNSTRGGVMLPAGTLQSTAGLLPQGWTPSPNVDPVNDVAVAAYTAAGPRDRGLMRQQYYNMVVYPPNYVWKLVAGQWTLVKVADWNRDLPVGED